MSRLKAFGIVLMVASSIALGWVMFDAVHRLVAPPSSSGSSASPLFGGLFSLVDHRGNVVTERSYTGKIKLIFFGFTSCPDICPTGLSLISDLLDALGGQAKEVQPIFITVDPERDTRQRLAEYVQAFHPSLIALTGTREQIDAVAKAYRIYYKKVPVASSEDYTVEHSAQIFVMGRKGEFLRFIDPDHESKDVSLGKLRLALRGSGG